MERNRPKINLYYLQIKIIETQFLRFKTVKEGLHKYTINNKYF